MTLRSTCLQYDGLWEGRVKVVLVCDVGRIILSYWRKNPLSYICRHLSLRMKASQHLTAERLLMGSLLIVGPDHCAVKLNLGGLLFGLR